MDETKLTAELPNLHIEVVRSDDSDARTETVTMRMTATPSFKTMHAALLQACLNPLAMSPFFAWTRMMQAAWAPWLSLMAPGKRRVGRTEDPATRLVLGKRER